MSEYWRWLSNPPQGEEIIISGISGRLPESDNIYEFRDNLFNKMDMITDNERRWKIDHAEIPNYTGKINHIDKFDGGNFGIHYRQADIMDPMTRILLETTYEAILDAGVNPAELRGSRTGVFVGGGSNSESKISSFANLVRSDRFVIPGLIPLFIPNTISYYFRLKGPSMITDTACSSTIHAIDLAVKAIRNGQCDNAIVAGVSLIIHPGVTLHFARLGALTMDGKCKVFDQSADGYVRSDTIGCIFLQKKKNAKRIYCQVMNIKTNCDGFKEEGIMFPSTQMQSQLMTEIFEEGGFDVNHLGYLEIHGTGTKVGDLEEVMSVDEAIGKKRRETLLVGAVKCNIGHAEAASGIGSIFKAIIAMETGLIPPNIHLANIKKGMAGLLEGRMKVVTETTKFEGEDALVGVNNFGFGATNGHILLKRFNKLKLGNASTNDSFSRLICVSGRTQDAVLTLLDDINKRPLDIEYCGLFHQIFKINFDEHLYRGFTIMSKIGPMRISSTRVHHFQTPWYVYLGDFTKKFRIFGQELLQYPCFQKIVQKLNKYLVNVKIDIVDIIKKNDSTRNDVLGSVLVQVAFLELLNLLGLKPSRICGKSQKDLSSSSEFLQDEIKSIFDRSCEKLENSKFNKTVIVLNLSDQIMNDKSIQIVNENDEVQFLEVLGRLFEMGYNPQLHKLYPEMQFPVGRGTPNISPLIKWNHHKSWFTYKFSEFGKEFKEKFSYAMQTEEHKYILGHVIDGRNLFAATEFLNVVWKTFATSNRQLPQDLPVVFENCKFMKALMVPPNGLVSLSVSIQKSSGAFEVIDKNSSILVYGRISSPIDIKCYQADLEPIEVDFNDPVHVIESDDIYKELNLRGYNYSGSFKKLLKCNSDASVGLVQWEDNWTTFMDVMLHPKILQLDTRALCIPTGLKKLSINPKKHMEFVKNQTEAICPVYLNKTYNIIQSGGIEIEGLRVTSINKRTQTAQPVLEKHLFVSNVGKFDLETSLRITAQIVLENSLENKFKALEIVDDLKTSNSDFVLPLLRKALQDIPLITPELIISTSNNTEPIEGIKFEKYVLTENSNFFLVVGSNLLQSSIFPSEIFDALSPSGFVLTREDLDFVPQLNSNFEIVFENITDQEKLILCRKSTQLKQLQFIKVEPNNFNWITELQSVLKSDENIVIFAQNTEPEGILGFLNCIRVEFRNRVKCFLIIDEAPEFDPQHSFYRDQLMKDLAVNVYKNGSWGVYRHLLLEDNEEVENEHCYATCIKRGDLSSVKWVEGPLNSRILLKENEILIYPYYSALNFKDIMIALGRVSLDSLATDRLILEALEGIEFSGRDSNGRRVMGITTNRALSNLILMDKKELIDVPEDWNLEDAATVVAVYSTVIFALIETGRIWKGASILIHSGTGGVGLAAINVCLHYNCEIFVTVGAEEKRDFIRKHFPQIPESHIGNSRDTSFEAMIDKETRSKGVDFVLNSLVEEKLLASVRCLAPGGCFLEIGKYDIGNNLELNLFLLKKNISFHGIMLDSMFGKDKMLILLEIFNRGIKEGYVKPLPRTIFKRNEVEKAFKYMTTGKHIGKVLIEINQEENIRSAIPSVIPSGGIPKFNCDSAKSYIIIGGLGGFGLELTDWLFLRGAKKLILVSRFGIKTGYHTLRIRNWRSYGVIVKVSTADVTTEEGCRQLIKEANDLGPVDGIFNLAVILQDGAFVNQTEESFLNSSAPKAQATRYLDEISQEMCPELRYFVVFSSVSCGRGNAGQTNYGMSNSVMERICEKRKLKGLPALAIQWGVVGDVGLVAKMQKENKELVIGGTLQQKIANCLEVLDKFLKQNNPVVSSMIVAEKKRLSGGTPVQVIASILGIEDIKKVGYYKTLAEMGMDSISTTEIVQVLEKEFGIFIPPKDLRNMTFAKLMELEKELDNTFQTSQVTVDKIATAKEFIMVHAPEPEPEGLTLERLPSAVADINENATIVLVFPGLEAKLTPLEQITANLKAHVFGAHYSYYNPEKTIQELARNLLLEIEPILKKNPKFNIIAYSFGVIVAQEVIGLLEIKGYFGRFIALDGSFPYMLATMKNVLSGNTDIEIENSLFYTVFLMSLPIATVPKHMEQLQEKKSFEDRIAYAKSLIPIVETKELNIQGSFTLIARIKVLINYCYEHKKIKSPLLLFKADNPIVKGMKDDYELSEHFQDVNVTVIKGDHETMLKDSSLVKCISDYINNNQ